MSVCDSNIKKKIGVKRNFSQEEKNELARLYNEGHSLREIGRMFDVSMNTIKTNIKDLVTFRPRTVAKEKNNREKIIRMYEEGESISYISNKIGANVNTIKQILGRADIDCIDIASLKYAEYLPKIIELAYEGNTLSEISKETNICKSTLSNYLNWLNKIPKDYYDKNRTYKLDIDYILSLEKNNLYELGLLLSTYSITNRNGTLGIDLYSPKKIFEEHSRVTRKFTNKNYLKADNYKNKQMYILNIISDKLFNYFNELDFEFIDKLNIDERKNFFKGYLLGCITYTPAKNKNVLGNEYFIDKYQIRFPNKEIFHSFLKYAEEVDKEVYFKISKLSENYKYKYSITLHPYQNDCEKILNTIGLDTNIFK